MNNQICPWKADSESYIGQGPSALFQAYETAPFSCSAKKISHHKRPSTSTQSQSITKQKKTIRPFSSTRNRPKTIKTSPLIMQQRCIYLPKSQSFCKNNLISIHSETEPRKKIIPNSQVIFTTHSNFMKQKLKRQEKPNLAITKSASEYLKKKQQRPTKTEFKQEQLFLNKKLLSILKLSKSQNSLIKNNLPNENKSGRAVIKKTGFVYYNQSFFQQNFFKFA